MNFNSIDFAVFMPVVFIVYWILLKNSTKSQNLFLLLASYFFYAWWDYRFLGLIVINSLVDFISGQRIYLVHDNRSRKIWLIISIIFNLGMLGFFKYYNFFIDSLNSSFTFFGQNINVSNLDIILPVGISFYTFQTLSYSIDIYRKKISPTNDLIAFLGYVSFFPQLVAGPIERASRLLPQFTKKREFNQDEVKRGFLQMIWGLFKKVAIADRIGIYVDQIFSNPSEFNSLILLMGVFYFSVQIYADFSGYSDIAIGVARMFGFKLKENFLMPNFSRDPSEYWRRWHISLSSWFKDYLYIPIGGSKGGKFMILRNTLLIFIISGLWHGADWTFVIWGALNGLLFLPLILTGNNRRYVGDDCSQSRIIPPIKELFQIIITFTLISFTRIFFRSENLTSSIEYTKALFAFNYNGSWNLPGIERYFFEIIPLIIVFTAYEWIKRSKKDQMIANWKEFSVTIIGILMFGVFSDTETFIYFQF